MSGFLRTMTRRMIRENPAIVQASDACKAYDYKDAFWPHYTELVECGERSATDGGRVWVHLNRKFTKRIALIKRLVELMANKPAYARVTPMQWKRGVRRGRTAQAVFWAGMFRMKQTIN